MANVNFQVRFRPTLQTQDHPMTSDQQVVTLCKKRELNVQRGRILLPPMMAALLILPSLLHL